MQTRRCVVRAPRRGRRGAEPRERGSASIEFVIVFPAVLTVIWLALQAALMFWGRSVILAAAQEGARAAAADGASSSDGYNAATAFVQDSSGGLRNVTVSGGRGATTATYTVSATTLSVIPGWNPVLTQTATMPVEHIS